MRAQLVRFLHEDSGQDLIEYGLLVGLITATVVTTITFIGTKVQEYFTSLQTNIKAT